MPITSHKYSIGVAAVEIAESGGNYEVHIHSASGTVYLGNASVTSSTGFKVDNGDKLVVTCPDGNGLYAIADSGTKDVYVLKVAL